MEQVFDQMTLDELLQKYETTYDKKIFIKNQEDFRAFLMQLINGKIEEFQTSESVLPYITYAKQKKEEHGLEKSELLDAFESKHKKLATKEKIGAGVAAAKGKLFSAADSIKKGGKGLAMKLPFNKKSADTPVQEEIPVSEDVSVLQIEQAEPEPQMEEVMPPEPEPQVEEITPPEPEPQVEEVAPPQLPTESQEVPATKECPQCGATVKATGKFCAKCGHRF